MEPATERRGVCPSRGRVPRQRWQSREQPGSTRQRRRSRYAPTISIWNAVARPEMRSRTGRALSASSRKNSAKLAANRRRNRSPLKLAGLLAPVSFPSPARLAPQPPGAPPLCALDTPSPHPRPPPRDPPFCRILDPSFYCRGAGGLRARLATLAPTIPNGAGRRFFLSPRTCAVMTRFFMRRLRRITRPVPSFRYNPKGNSAYSLRFVPPDDSRIKE